MRENSKTVANLKGQLSIFFGPEGKELSPVALNLLIPLVIRTQKPIETFGIKGIHPQMRMYSLKKEPMSSSNTP